MRPIRRRWIWRASRGRGWWRSRFPRWTRPAPRCRWCASAIPGIYIFGRAKYPDEVTRLARTRRAGHPRRARERGGHGARGHFLLRTARHRSRGSRARSDGGRRLMRPRASRGFGRGVVGFSGRTPGRDRKDFAKSSVIIAIWLAKPGHSGVSSALQPQPRTVWQRLDPSLTTMSDQRNQPQRLSTPRR